MCAVSQTESDGDCLSRTRHRGRYSPAYGPRHNMAGLHSHWVIMTDGLLPWKRDLSELRGRLGGIVYLTFCYGLLTDY
jgi:hypothetical protein